MDRKSEYIIDKFLRKELSQKEKIKFEKMFSDKSFYNLLQKYKLMTSYLKEKDAIELKKYLVEIENKISNKKTKYIINFIKSIAAVFILSTILLGSNYKAIFTNSRNKIYSEYYHPYPNIIAPISKGENNHNIYQMYEMKKYGYVINTLSQKSELNKQEYFYLGSSYLALSNYEKAMQQFNKTTTDSVFGFASEWYLALIYLQMDTNKSKQRLRKISDNKKQIYNRLANEVLEIINN